MISAVRDYFLISPAIIAMLITFSSSSQAAVPGDVSSQEQSLTEVADTQSSQATSVSQLSDVLPTDWAFQALQSLVERYGCAAGYPNQTYRGNRSLTRYEFAAGLNSCLDKINELIATSTTDLLKKQDLETLQKLQEQFGTELVTLRKRVDTLEGKTATLAAEQFSTTTKLHGQIIFALSSVSGGNQSISKNFIPSFDPTNNPNTQYQDAKGNVLGITTQDANAIYGIDDGANFGNRRSNNFIFSDRVRLEFDTSFTGRDKLLIRLQAQNTPESKLATGTNAGRLSFDGDNNNQVETGVINYSFPIGKKTQVTVTPNQELYEILEGVISEFSPLLDDDNGAISKFGRFNPIFRLGGETVRGAAVTHKLNPAAKLSLVYAGTGNANDPQYGLLNDGYVAMAHLTLKPIERLTLGLTYANSYSSDTTSDASSAFDREVGSKLATNPFPSLDSSAAIANSYGFEAAYNLSRQLKLAGWIGYGNVQRLSGEGKAEILNWAVETGVRDIGKRGSLLGLVFGQPPKVISNTYGPQNPSSGAVVGGAESDTSYHYEAFYRYPVNDNIAITPGFIYITNPENNKANDNVFAGVIRTTFTF